MSSLVDLQLLVASMTAAEKRYFKLNAVSNSRTANGQFVHLFDAIDKGLELKKRPGENRSVTNAYLYVAILQCLDAFHEKNSINFRIDRLIRNATLLYNRGLPEQALKLFLKVESIAWNQQEFVRLQSIYWYVRTLLAMNVTVSQSPTMQEVLDRNHFAAKQIELMSRLRYVQYRFQQVVAKTASLTPDILEELRALYSSEAMNEVTDQSGFFEQLTASHVRSQYYALINDNQAGFEQGKRVFELCFSHRELLQERGRLMIGSANNYMMRCQRAREFDELKRVLVLLETESSKDNSVEMIRLETYYSNLLSYHILTKQFDRADLLPELEKVLQANSGKMNQAFLMYIYSFASQYAFFRKDLREALKWINLFLNHDNRIAFSKNLSVATDYRLLIYYEQNKYDLIESLLNSKSAFSEVPNEFPALRRSIHQFLSNELLKGETRIQNLRKFQSALNTVKENDEEREGANFFPFSDWISAKLTES